jgi:hypothetical protein
MPGRTAKIKGEMQNDSVRSLAGQTESAKPSFFRTDAMAGSDSGYRILRCSGEHRQQVGFVETTKQPFLSQANLVYMILPQ